MGFDAQIFCFVCFIQSLYIKALVVCFILASNEIKSLSLLSLCALFISIFIHFSNRIGHPFEGGKPNSLPKWILASERTPSKND